MVDINDITVIVPVHTWSKEIEKMLTEAIKSIPLEANVIISTVNGSGVEIKDGLLKEFKSGNVISKEGGSSFQALVNNGVKNTKTEWFSILEFDDEYSKIWFPNFQKYQEYNQQYNIFYPMVDLYNVEDGKDEFVGNGNEAVWAASFSEEIGVIDEQSIADFFDFYPTGGIFRKSTWEEIGGLKENIKLTFWYEFMLRAAHNGEKIFVVPKIGYAHVIGRKDSLLMNYRETIDNRESEFWYKTAKKESYVNTDRPITYVPKEAVMEDNDKEN